MFGVIWDFLYLHQAPRTFSKRLLTGYEQSVRTFLNTKPHAYIQSIQISWKIWSSRQHWGAELRARRPSTAKKAGWIGATKAGLIVVVVEKCMEWGTLYICCYGDQGLFRRVCLRCCHWFSCWFAGARITRTTCWTGLFESLCVSHQRKTDCVSTAGPGPSSMASKFGGHSRKRYSRSVSPEPCST